MGLPSIIIAAGIRITTAFFSCTFLLGSEALIPFSSVFSFQRWRKLVTWKISVERLSNERKIDGSRKLSQHSQMKIMLSLDVLTCKPYWHNYPRFFFPAVFTVVDFVRNSVIKSQPVISFEMHPFDCLCH